MQTEKIIKARESTIKISSLIFIKDAISFAFFTRRISDGISGSPVNSCKRVDTNVINQSTAEVMRYAVGLWRIIAHKNPKNNSI